MECVNSITKTNKDRVNYLLNTNRKDRTIPEPDTHEEQHRIGCWSNYKLFTYEGMDYYFGILWGEEDKMGKNGKLLVGNGLAHILVNHGSNFSNILKHLNMAIFSMDPENIKKDRWGNLEITVYVACIKYVFKNYKELNDNYFYLHTAF